MYAYLRHLLSAIDSETAFIQFQLLPINVDPFLPLWTSTNETVFNHFHLLPTYQSRPFSISSTYADFCQLSTMKTDLLPPTSTHANYCQLPPIKFNLLVTFKLCSHLSTSTNRSWPFSAIVNLRGLLSTWDKHASARAEIKGRSSHDFSPLNGFGRRRLSRPFGKEPLSRSARDQN